MASFNLVTREGKKGKLKCDYNMQDIYRYYAEQTGPAGLTKQQHGAFIRDLNEAIINAILAKPDAIQLMCHCGNLSIKKYQQSFKNPKKLRVDWAASKKAKKRIYHLNEHRNGYKYHFSWERSRNVSNITAYSYVAPRTAWRKLAHILKTDMSIDYMERVTIKKKPK